MWGFKRVVPRRAYHVKLSSRVQQALAKKQPIVSLESTIITHGLPYPHNFEMAKSVEAIIESEGCVPATTAFIDGVPRVGLEENELYTLSTAKGLIKVSRRDMAYVMAQKLSGGTTIAGTMILSHKAGIKVFGTGGLGGVHRRVEDTLDISADLDELGRTPVAVVCAGPKSILDIPKTIEYLETKGVYVSTMGPAGTNIPGFFTRDSGVPSPFNFSSPKEAADIVSAGTSFGLESGYVFCVPCPDNMSMNPLVISSAVDQALVEADKNGVTGKAITPYLLKKVWEITKGDTVATNIEFVQNNARVAAQIAREMALSDGSVSVQIPTSLAPQPKAPAQKLANTRPRTKVDVVVVGSLAQDLTCTLSTSNISPSSFPGKVSSHLGGVGHNVALASAYSGATVRLITAIGEKEAPTIRQELSPAIDAGGILVADGRTARYVSMNDSDGQLIVACADMDMIKDLSPDHIKKEVSLSDAEVVVFDGNLGKEQIAAVLASEGLKIFEPTSVPKAARIADQDLKLFPAPSVNVATPNVLELMSLFEEFSFQDKFNSDHWFPIIDALPMNDAVSQFKIERFLRVNPPLKNALQSGLFQAGVQLSPYIPNLFVKLGSEGVLSFQLIEHLKDRTGDTADGRALYLLSQKKPFGLLVQFFPVPKMISQELVQSVNGVGDTFCGVLAAELAESRAWLRDDGPIKRNAIMKAQSAAALSLQTMLPVNSNISDL